MPTITRSGVRLFYEDTGGAGVPILLHTGGGGDHRMWLLAGYTQCLGNARLLGLDHRGHGKSDQPGDRSAHGMREYVADVVAVLDAAEVDRAAFVGYSAGAAIGYRLAAWHPDRCLALVALGSAPSPEPDPQDDSIERADRIRSLGMRTVVEQMASAESERAPEWLVQNLVDTPTEMFALMVEAWAGDDDEWDVLAEIGVPTLLIAGAAELGAHDLGRAASRLVDGRALVLPGYGHLQSFWHGEVTGPAIAEFFRSSGLRLE